MKGILLTWFSSIDNVYADNQQIMQKWWKLIAETVSRNKVIENVGEIWFKKSLVLRWDDRSKAVFFCGSFMFFSVLFCYTFARDCLFVPCDHLLGKGWPLDSRLWCLTVSLSLSHRYPGSSVVLDCIDSWSLHPYLLYTTRLEVCFWPCIVFAAFFSKFVLVTFKPFYDHFKTSWWCFKLNYAGKAC